MLFEVTCQKKIFPNCFARLASHFATQFLERLWVVHDNEDSFMSADTLAGSASSDLVLRRVELAWQ